MPTGFDTTENCSALAAQIKANNFDFVGRYLSSHSWKLIRQPEAQALTDAGLAIVLIYEDGPTSSDYFSYGRGEADGTRAAQQAAALNAPDNTAVYFAVDYDASETDIGGVVTQYFRGVAAALAQFAANPGKRYRVGVYGSGATCGAMVTAQLASLSWIACSTGWSGHDYTGWAISQRLPTHVLGLSVDPDTARGDYGAIPAAPAVA